MRRRKTLIQKEYLRCQRESASTKVLNNIIHGDVILWRVMLSRFKDIFEHGQIFLELSLHLFFHDILAEFHPIDDVCLHEQFDHCISLVDIERERCNGLEWTGKGFESVPAGWLELGDFKGGLDPLTHKIAHTLKTCPQPVDLAGKPGGCQCSILPLEIVLRCAHKFKDPFNRLTDKRI
jgi:hypothetical protein